jgi:predicted anti-sigma-YlaC factor YlaD
MGVVPAAECERAHLWASLGLDGELSEVEQALLRAHVGRCTACAAFSRDLDGLTQELRTAAPQRPVGVGVTIRRRTTRVRLLQLGAVGAAISVAVVPGSRGGSLDSLGSAHA